MRVKLSGQKYKCHFSSKEVRLVKQQPIRLLAEKSAYAVFDKDMANLIGYVSRRLTFYFEFQLGHRRLPIYYWIAFRRHDVKPDQVIAKCANTRAEVIAKLLGW